MSEMGHSVHLLRTGMRWHDCSSSGSRPQLITSRCRRRANTGCEQSQQKPLFDHLVGAAGERKRDGDTERLGGFEIQDQLDFHRLLDRQVRGLLALENPTCIYAGLMKRVCNVGTVAHQTTAR